MINKRLNISKKNFLLILYLVILAFIGPLIYWLNESKSPNANLLSRESKNIGERVSSGDKILITANNSVEAKEGNEAFAKGDYEVAAQKFAAILQRNPNNPEALIYRNNAEAIAVGNTYKIGVGVPIGGNLGVAKEILRGVAQAQNEINQSGGISGKSLVVEIANDDNEPKIAEQVAQSFVRDKEILAVVGHNDSNASIAAASIYQQKGLVMITPTSSADVIPTIGTYIFRTTPNTRALAGTLADYTVNVAGKTKIAICVDSQSAVSTSFKEEFTWSVYNIGGKILPTQCDLSASDFLASKIVSRAISDGADTVLLAPSVKRIGKAVEIAKVNDDRLTLLSSHGMITYSTLKEGQADVNGMVGVVAWHPSGEINTSFVKEAQALWGGSVGWRTAMAYDATKTIFAGLTLGSDRDRLQEVLANRKFAVEGASETINFLPSGDRNMQGTLVKIQPGNKTDTGFDFVSLENQ